VSGCIEFGCQSKAVVSSNSRVNQGSELDSLVRLLEVNREVLRYTPPETPLVDLIAIVNENLS
jgi:hypothetical protein